MSSIRELFVELGFRVKTKQFEQFNKLIESSKKRINDFKNSFKFGRKAGDSDDLQNKIQKRFQNYRSYHDEIKSLSKEDQRDIKALNTLEKRAIRDVLAEEKAKYKEIGKQDKRLNTTRILQTKKRSLFDRGFQRYNTGFNLQNQNLLGYIRKLAFGIMSTLGAFSGVKSTLRDIQNFRARNGSTFSKFSRREVQTAITFAGAFKQLAHHAATFRNTIVLQLLPSLTKLIIEFNKFIVQNKALIQQKIGFFLKTVVDSFVKFFDILVSVKRALDPLVEKMGGWVTILQALVGISVFSWITTIIRGLGLYFVVILQATGITKIFRLAVVSLSALLTLGSWIYSAAKSAGLFAGVVSSLVGILRILGGVTAFVATRISPLGVAITLVSGAIGYLLTGSDNLNKVFNAMKTSVDFVIDSIKTLWEWLVRVKNGFTGFLSSVPSLNLPSREDILRESQRNLIDVSGSLNGGQSSLNKSKPSVNFSPNNNYSFNINVNSSKTEDEAKDMGQLIKKELDKHMQYEYEKYLLAIGGIR